MTFSECGRAFNNRLEGMSRDSSTQLFRREGEKIRAPTLTNMMILLEGSRELLLFQPLLTLGPVR